MVEHAFFNMNLHRIALGALADNQRAQHVYEKIGFVREGVERQSVFKKGKFVDMIRYALLRDEYIKLNGQNAFCPQGGGLPTFCVSEIPTSAVRMNLIRLMESVFPHHVASDAYEEFLQKVRLHACFLVTHRLDVLGVAAFYANDRESGMAYLTHISVKQEAQGQHIGSCLLCQVEIIAKLQGMDTIKLEVRDDNQKARDFYQTHGYQETGEKTATGLYMIKKL